MSRGDVHFSLYMWCVASIVYTNYWYTRITPDVNLTKGSINVTVISRVVACFSSLSVVALCVQDCFVDSTIRFSLSVGLRMHSWLEESLARTTSLTLLRTLFRLEAVFKHAFDVGVRYNHHCQWLKCEGNGFWYIHVYTVQMYTCVYVCLPSPMLPLKHSLFWAVVQLESSQNISSCM